MDLSKINTVDTANEGVKLELRDPAGAPLLTDDKRPITITLRGRDSAAFVKHENEATNRRLAAGARLKLTAQALKGEALAGLAKCTVAWDGIKVAGEEWSCTYENAIRLYTDFPFIKDQVDEFVGERANFLKE